jgi:hypothetical protein
LWGKQTRDKEEGKKSSNKAERGDKAPTRNALALSQLSLSVVVVFKADLSLFNLSPFVSCGGKQQSVDTLNKEEAKKLEHKSGGVKKHEHRNCSESALFSLFCCFLSCAFSTKPYEIIPSEVRGDLLSLSTKVRFSPLLLYKRQTLTTKMAFTKAFYEQAFERNLKAQTTSSEHVTPAMQMTRTQRATAQFTAHSKKEVVSTLESIVFEKIQM